MRICTRIVSVLLLLALCAPGARGQRDGVRDADRVESYVQYLPDLAYLGLGLAGVPVRHCLGDQALTLAAGYIADAMIVLMLKQSVYEKRPDGEDARSFPSGHTSKAFLGAELVRCEYGWGWGAGAYALATAVGVMRVQHQRHYWWDALVGAGIGIMSAHIGLLLREPVGQLFGISFDEGSSIAFTPSMDPLSGALCAGITYKF